MNIIIPIGGKSERFLKEGYKTKKHLIKIFNKEMILYVLDNLFFEKNDKIFIICYQDDKEILKKIINAKYNITFSILNFQTRGAAETLYLGLKNILPQTTLKNTVVLDCDTFYTENIIKMYRNISNNNCVFYNDNKDTNPIYSYINIDENGYIYEIKEKIKISDNANTGIYCFNDISILYKYAEKINKKINDKECYTSFIIDEMIKDNHIFKAIKLEKKFVFNLGTVKQLKTYIDNTFLFLFDLDGTLVLTETIYFEVWKEIFKKYNIHLSKELFENFIFGNNDKYVVENLLPDNSINISKIKDELFLNYIENKQYLPVLIEGVVDFLKFIRINGHRMGLVTNCNRLAAESVIKELKIDNYFDFLVVGNECEKAKPYPEPYIYAMNNFNTTNDKIMVFEDSKSGLLSANGISPKCIVGIETLYNSKELIINHANITTKNYINYDILYENIINYKNDNIAILKKQIYNSIMSPFVTNDISSIFENLEIDNISINNQKLKGGFISDVLEINIIINDKVFSYILKLENTNENFLSKMSKDLELYKREYYFYDSLSRYIPIDIPKYICLIKNDNNDNIGVLLENLSNTHNINLDLSKENINISLKVIDSMAKMHSKFWNKNIDIHFKDLKKNSDFDWWCDFVLSKWDMFKNKWSTVLSENQFKIGESIIKNYEKIQDSLSDNNLTLIHGDVKSPNIFYRISDNEPCFIDWQYIGIGKGVQDLVFFIIESFDIKTIKLYKDIFKNYYYVKLKEYKVSNYSMDEFEKDYLNASYCFPFFVAIWFGCVDQDDLIDKNFPFFFIKKLFTFYELNTIN